MDKVAMTLAEAEAAWRANKTDAGASGDYLLRLIAAVSLGQLDKDTFKAQVVELTDVLESLIPPHVAKLAKDLLKAGAPVEVVQAAMRAAESVPDGHELQVISVGADGVATILGGLSSDENDGIGRPVGNA